MAIWSLTKERVDKLQKMIDDRETEIDVFSKLTPEDIWKKDLDDFIDEWRLQLDEEARRQKKAASQGRRASKKLNVAAGAGRKRKVTDSDDSDFGASKTKKPTKPPKAVGGMLNYLAPKEDPKTKVVTAKPKAQSAVQKTAQSMLDQNVFSRSKDQFIPQEKTADVWLNLDGAGPDLQKSKKPATSTAPKKSQSSQRKVSLSDSDASNEQDQAITKARKPRAAASKTAKYALSDSDDSDANFDIGNMVKGINTTTAAVDTSRPLFSAALSRPGSSAGRPSSVGFSKKPSPALETIDFDGDETDYTKLAPPTTSKERAVTARNTILSDDEQDFDMPSMPPKASKPAARQPKASAPKPRAMSKKPTPAPQAEVKKMALSPAAKAYAAKKARAAKKQAEEEDDDLDLIADGNVSGDEDGSEPVKPAAAARGRPARAAAVAPKKKWVVSDEEDDGDGVESESEADFDDGVDDESFD